MSVTPRARRGDRGVRLSEILVKPRFVACDDIVARGCHADPDRCGPGDVFVARTTSGGDGHELVERAVARGVAGVLAERMVATAGTPLCLVDDVDHAHARLCQALAGDPAAALKLIAVTGTSGKTTTAWLAAAVLAEAGRRVGVLSDLGCLDAESTLPERAAYAEPAALAAWLERLVANGCTHAVVEVSSRMLARQSLAGVTAALVAVPNIATAHLDLHGTTRAYRALKGRILDALGPGGCLVTGTPSATLDRLRRRAARTCDQPAFLSAGLTAGCDITAVPVERGLYGQTFLLRAGGQSVPVAVDTPTAAFVADAVVAAAIGMRCGVSLELAARGIEAAGAVPGRMERLDRGQDGAVFLDMPTSGHALAATLAGLRRLTPGRLAVIADERWVRGIGTGAVRRRIARWCDECLLVPATMMSTDAADADITAYARLDRLLNRLGRRDCLLVLGDPRIGGGEIGGPDDGEQALADVVDGWLRLAHPPRARLGRRAA
jgi:UDP-N-acetylmuramoyl-L-alanyl-D-glutamate--2,6-diaminopimelate ligase